MHKATTFCVTFSTADSFSFTKSAMQSAIIIISSSFIPLAVTAGVPILTPLVTKGFCVSKGIAFLFDRVKNFFNSVKMINISNNGSNENNFDNGNTKNDIVEMLKENLLRKDNEIEKLKNNLSKNNYGRNAEYVLRKEYEKLKEEKELIVKNSKSLAQSLKEVLIQNSNLKGEINKYKNIIEYTQLKISYDKLLNENSTMKNELIEKNCKINQYEIENKKNTCIDELDKTVAELSNAKFNYKQQMNSNHSNKRKTLADKKKK